MNDSHSTVYLPSLQEGPRGSVFTFLKLFRMRLCPLSTASQRVKENCSSYPYKVLDGFALTLPKLMQAPPHFY